MPTGKRILVATLSGLMFGLVCMGFATSGPGDVPTPAIYQIITSRMLIGFAIGVSGLTCMRWWAHGLLMGFIFSVPLATGGLMAPESPEFNKGWMFFGTLLFGVVYGLLIELITSIFFKSRITPMNKAA
ncbi:MAG: hypothetical protein FJY73_09470 [Candidatus Eisenbacteria bacterium]|nr:hypothetical protein [Candidatus Eisenbacteria bacterium]